MFLDFGDDVQVTDLSCFDKFIMESASHPSMLRMDAASWCEALSSRVGFGLP